MPKRKLKKPAAPKVKTVVLPETAVLEVVVPKGLVPIVATDPDKGVVKIIPVPAAKLKEKSWFEKLFG